MSFGNAEFLYVCLVGFAHFVLAVGLRECLAWGNEAEHHNMTRISARCAESRIRAMNAIQYSQNAETIVESKIFNILYIY